MEVGAHARLADLPRALFPAPAVDFFSSLPWYQTVLDHALPGGAAPCFAVAARGGLPRAALPLLMAPGAPPASLTTPYTCRFAPLYAPDITAPEQTAAAAAFARFGRAFPLIRLDALDDAATGLAPLIAGMRQAGLAVERFDHFGNWHEPVRGQDWDTYLAARPGALRTTLRRKLKRAAGETRFELISGPAGLEAGIAAYEAVYAASWKHAEPFPRFNAALMRAIAPLGLLRLALLHGATGPIAAQFWIRTETTATVLKLAHLETARALSPGTVLTALVLRALLAEGGITSLDFGRGDDPYKALWTSLRRQRVGLLLINPRHPSGMMALLRHRLGRLRRRWRRQGTQHAHSL
jgi:CelD/BcsL family acetyltransferase involved in cellulose biosynthesis